MEQQRQSGKGQADGLRGAMEREIRQLHLALKQASLYPEGHPIHARAAGEVYELVQEVLSSQESHSLTAIADKRHIDQLLIDGCKTNDDEQSHIALEEMSADIARKFRRRGIRSVAFSRGMELWELERFLDIMNMRAKEVMDQGGAAKLLSPSSDVSHIEVVDIEYENIQFVTADSKEDDAGEMLVSYLGGRTESLANTARMHFLSLLQKPDLMARLVEKCAGYDGTSEPNAIDVIQSLDKLVSLVEQFTDIDEERRDFEKNLLQAIFRMEAPVKNALFSASDDSGTLTRLISGLSADEIAEHATVESGTDGPPVPLRRMLDEFLASDQTSAFGSPEERFAEVEVAIQSELGRRGQEDIFDNKAIQLLEEVFTELEVNRLEGEKLESGRPLDKRHSPEHRQAVEYGAEEMTDLFAAEDDVANFAFVMLEMLESETSYDDYSDITDRLEEVVKFLIGESQDAMGMRCQCLSTVLYIIDALFEQADAKSDNAPELQKRARKAIANMGTQEVINRVILSWLGSDQLAWGTLERFMRQMGGKAVPSLVENRLNVENPPERHRLGKILISMGSSVAPEFRRWLSQVQPVVVVKDIIPILKEIGGTEALDFFSDALDHSSPQVRRAAVSALAISTSPRAAKLILSKIRDTKEEESIRLLAISTLGKLGDGHVVEEIKTIINGKNAVLGREAIQALGDIGGEKSVSILSDLLKRRRLILGRRRVEELQLHAVAALSQIDSESAIEALLERSRQKKGKVESACDKALQSHLQIKG